MMHVDSNSHSNQSWRADWTRPIIVLGAVSALLFAVVFAASPQPTGQAGAGHSSAPSTVGSVVSAPSGIVDNCSVDVSKPLRQWLQQLPPGSTWNAPAGACYLINEGINVYNPVGLTINGGTFVEKTWGHLSRIGINIQGGQNVTTPAGGKRQIDAMSAAPAGPPAPRRSRPSTNARITAPR